MPARSRRVARAAVVVRAENAKRDVAAVLPKEQAKPVKSAVDANRSVSSWLTVQASLSKGLA